MPQIVVENLSKTYAVSIRDPGVGGATKGLFRRKKREVLALDRVSFSLERGELLGFIGPNGAGKSTTIKLLSGIMRPTSGTCVVDGRVPWRERIAHVARIGVVFGQRTQLWWDLPIEESFALLRDIYRVPRADFTRMRDYLVEILRIAPLLATPLRQLSLGQRMRCEIAAALLHNPSILFLDEPTIGLDAVSKLAVREFVKSLNRERGVTVILTTHDMHDVEALVNRVVVIGNGRVLRDSSLENFRMDVLAERRLVVEFADEPQDIRISDSVLRARDGRRIVYGFDPRRTSAHALIDRVTRAHEVTDIRIEEPPIEEVIARFYAQHGAAET